MPKHYKEMMDELINKMDEDAPANAVAHGGVDMAPNAKRKPKDDVSTRADADAEDMLRRTIVKKLGKNVKENMDNNNIILKRVNETLNRIEDKIDEKSGIVKEEVKVESKKTFYDKFIKDLASNTPHEGMFDEEAPNTADAMKRFKSGKAGFTDKAHLKAKGLIPRADGTKKVSDKYKEELEATNAKLDALKDFMSKLESFEVALGKATEPAQPKVIKEVQEKIIYREFDPANVKPKVVWKQPVQEVVEPEVPEVIQEAQPKVEDTQDFVSRIAGQMSKSIDREKANTKPVTKLNEQKSALDQLREEFQVFKQNVITQLASLGGGGSVNLLDLDDVDISSLGNGKFLVFNSSSGKLEFTDQVDGN